MADHLLQADANKEQINKSNDTHRVGGIKLPHEEQHKHLLILLAQQ